MKTDVIRLGSDLSGRREAIEEAERFAEYHHITGKNATHLRLLTEETISMVHGILRGFEGDFWIESEKRKNGRLCRICVAADTSVSESQEDEFLQMASSGKNEEAKGFLGMIREIFRWSVQRSDENVHPGSTTAIDVMYGMGMPAEKADDGESFWSMQRYRSNLQEKAQETAGQAAWDEMEKSIVANLSDEIRIGITDERATVTVERFFQDAVTI